MATKVSIEAALYIAKKMQKCKDILNTNQQKSVK